MMIRKLFLNDRFIAVTEDDSLVEYIPVTPDEACGDILLGRVERMMPGMNSAFIGIGRKRSGYMPLKESSDSFTGSSVQSGKNVIVQIRKEEFGNKGAYLTRDVTFPGKYVLLMPLNRHIGISSKITDADTKKRLYETGRVLSRNQFGLILRAAAADADPASVREETEELLSQWKRILHEANSANPPYLLWKQHSPAEQIKNDYTARGGIYSITEIQELTEDLARQLRNAGCRQLKLRPGGNIVIDRCEAMTVIDVNSAGDTAGSDEQQIFLETNLEACEEILRQVRLRNLSGIIMIDFINLKNETERNLVLEKLREGFGHDRIKTVVHGVTSLGLVEITRKRSRADWYELETEPCPYCKGVGRIRRNEGHSWKEKES